jgi:hypothetical protein
MQEAFSLQPLSATVAFLEMVQQERVRQDEKWGVQDWPISVWCTILAEEFGEFAREVGEIDCGREGNLERAVKELVETVAVAQSIYEQYLYKRLVEKRGGK